MKVMLSTGTEMFTGIIEETGYIKSIVAGADGKYLEVSAKRTLCGIKLGDSIAVDGCCLTVTEAGDKSFKACVSSETLERSIIGLYSIGQKVNLERAMIANGRLDGHLVQGHVDGVGSVVSVVNRKNTVFVKISVQECLTDFFVEKGSVAVNGVSLTVSGTDRNIFEVSLIPFTLDKTNISDLKRGSKVNIETDIIGKYVVNMMKEKQSSLTESFLAAHGFMS